MALKYNITAAEYAALSAELKDEYSGDATSGYKLDITGIDLKRGEKYDNERGLRRAAENKARTLEDELNTLKNEDDRPALVDRHNKDMKRERDAKEAAESKYRDFATSTLLNGTVDGLSGKLSPNHANLIKPHVKSRLKVDFSDPAGPKIVVLDKEGKDSATTLEELRAEFVANPEFAAIIRATPASGGLANSREPSPRSGNPSGAPTNDPASPSGRAGQSPAISARELAQRITERRQASGQTIFTGDADFNGM